MKENWLALLLSIVTEIPSGESLRIIRGTKKNNKKKNNEKRVWGMEELKKILDLTTSLAHREIEISGKDYKQAIEESKKEVLLKYMGGNLI